MNPTSVILLEAVHLNVFTSGYIPFTSAGRIKLQDFSLTASPDIYLTSLVDHRDNHAVETLLSQSTVQNIQFLDAYSTFLSTGRSSLQIVRDCSFLNVTTVPTTDTTHTLRVLTAAERSELSGSTIFHSGDLIHGSLVTGLSFKTFTSFTASNNTFSHIHRVHSPYSFSNEYDCGSEIGGKTEYEKESFTKDWCKPSTRGYMYAKHGQRPEYIFTHCSFHDIFFKDGDGHGGALNALGRDKTWFATLLQISDSNFTKCYSENKDPTQGGGVWAKYFMTVLLERSNFTSCCTDTENSDYAVSGAQHAEGGALYLQDITTLTVDTCRFTKCYTGKNGGAITLRSVDDVEAGKSTVTIKGSTFDDCKAKASASDSTGGGGALFFIGIIYKSYSKKVSIEESTFTNCQTSLPSHTSHGGAIFVQYFDAFELKSSSFTNCYTSSDSAPQAPYNCGGAIYLTRITSITIKEATTFSGCYTGSRGGAICISHVKSDQAIGTPAMSVSISGCTFQNCYTKNTKTGEQDSQGGAISVTGVSDSIDTSKIHDFSLLSSTFTDCYCAQTNKAGLGGAAYLTLYGTAHIKDCTVSGCHVPSNSDNQAKDSIGGGMHVSSIGNLLVQQCTFDGCYAGKEGGGIYLSSIKGPYNSIAPPASKDYVINSCTFTNCYTKNDANEYCSGGGACLLIQESTLLKIYNCLFKSCSCANSMQGGGLTYYASKVNLNNGQAIQRCRFANNGAASGHDVYIVTTSAPSTSTIDEYSFTLTSNTNRVAVKAGQTTYFKDTWLPVQRVVYVATEAGTDDGLCLDSKTTSCTTIKAAFDKRNTNIFDQAVTTLATKIYILSSHTETIEGMDTAGVALTLTALTATTTLTLTCTANPGPFITTQASTTELSSFILTFNPTPTEQKLFELKNAGGKLQLTSMVVTTTGGKTFSTSIIDITQGSFVCTQTEFKQFSSSSSLFTFADITKVTFTSSKMTSNTCSSGPALFAFTLPLAGYSLAGLTVKDCGLAEEGALGYGIEVTIDSSTDYSSSSSFRAPVFEASSNTFVKHQSGMVVNVKESEVQKLTTVGINSLSTTTAAEEHRVYVQLLKDNDGAIHFTTILSHLYNAPTGTLSTDDDGYSGRPCGWADLPCLPFATYTVTGVTTDDDTCTIGTCGLLSTAITTATAQDSVKPITIKSTLSPELTGDGFSVSKTLTISGNTNKETNKITLNHQSAKVTPDDTPISIFYITGSSTLTLTKLTLIIDSQQGAISTNVITLTTGTTLSLDSICFEGTGDSGVNGYVIDASAGKLSLKNVEFKTLKLTNKPLLHVDLTTANAAFTVDTSATFTDITIAGNSGKSNGAVLEEEIDTGKTLTLTGATFTGCGTTTDGSYGAALKLTLKKTGASIGSLTLTDGMFSGSEWTDPKKCAVIFAASSGAPTSQSGEGTSITYGNIFTDYGLQSLTATANKFYVDVTASPTFIGSLSHFLQAPTVVFAVSPSETGTKSYPPCGWTDLPCSSIPVAIYLIESLRNGAGNGWEPVVSVSTGEYTSPATEQKINHTLTIQGDYTGAHFNTIITERSAIGTLSEAYPVIIKQIKVKVASSAFLTNTGVGGATIDTVNVAMGDGVTTLDNAMITSTAGHLTLKALQMEGIESTTSLVSITGNSASLTVEGGCSFKQITTGAGVINVNQGLDTPQYSSTISISDAVFDSCSSSTDGGAISIILSDTSTTLSLGDDTAGHTVFSGCRATGGNKLGGAIYLTIVQPITINKLKFETSGSSAQAAEAAGGGIFMRMNIPDNFRPIKTESEPADIQSIIKNIDAPDDTYKQEYFSYKTTNGNEESMFSGLFSFSALVPQSTASLLTAIGDSNTATEVSKRTITLTDEVSLSQQLSAIKYDVTLTKEASGALKLSHSEDSTSPYFTVGAGVDNVLFTVTSVQIKIDASTTDVALTQPIFAIASGTGYRLLLNGITITADSGTSRSNDVTPVCYTSASLINAQNGILTLKGVTFSYIITANHPLLLLSTTASNFIMDTPASTFQSITRQIGRGAVIEAEIEIEIDTNKGLNIANSQFIACTCTNDEDGTSSPVCGAVYIKLTAFDKALLSISSTAKFYHTSSVSGSDTPFTGAGDSAITFGANAAQLGVAGPDLNTVITQLESGDWTEKEHKYYAVWFNDDYSTVTATAQLSHFMNKPSSQLYVTGKGFLLNTCGWKDLPCSSIDTPVDTLGSTKGTITLASGTYSATAVLQATLSSPITISGTLPGASTHMNTEDGTTITLDGSVFVVSAAAPQPPAGSDVLIQNMAVSVAENAGTFVQQSGTCTTTLSTLTFIGTGDTDKLASPLVKGTSGTLELKHVIVKTVTLTKDPLISATSTIKITDQSSFTTIIREGGSGAVLEAELSSGTTISLAGSSFTACSSSAVGASAGAVLITLTRAGGTLTLTDTTFAASTVNTDKDAWTTAAHSAITFIADSFKLLSSDNTETGYNLNSLVTDLNTANMEKKYYAKITPDGPLSQLKYYITTLASNPIIDGSKPSAFDFENCGSEQLPCKTFSYKVNSKGGSYTLAKGKFEQTETVALTSTTLSVTGAGKADTEEGSIVIVSTSASYSVSTSLTLSNLRLKQTVEEERMTTSFIDASIGTLSLTNVVFDSIKLTNVPLLSIGLAENSLTLGATVEFLNIDRQTASGGGAVLEIPSFDKDSHLKIVNSKFEGCRVGEESAHGGSIYIKLAATVGTNSNFEISKTTVTFTPTEDITPDGSKFIYIDGSDDTPSKRVSPSGPGESNDEGATVDTGSENEENAFAIQHAAALAALTPSSSTTSPFIYKLASEDEVPFTDLPKLVSTFYLADDAPENADCLAQTGCKLLSKAITDAPEGKALKIVKDKSITAEQSGYSITKSLTLCGSSTEPTEKLIITQQDYSTSTIFVIITNEGSKTFKLENLIVSLSLAEAQLGKSVLGTGTRTGGFEGTYECENVIFTPAEGSTGTLTQPLISASTGCLILTSVTFSNIALADTCLLSVQHSAEGFAITEETYFTGITRTGEGGAVFEATIASGEHLDLTNAHFQGCGTSSNNMLAGALVLTLEENGQLTLTGSQFTNAEGKDSWTTLGYVAALFIVSTVDVLKSDTYNLINQLGDVTTEVTEATEKKYYERHDGDTTRYPLCHSFVSPFETKMEDKTVTVAPTGTDSEYCGWSDLRCKTISPTFLDAELLTINVIQSVQIDQVLPIAHTFTISTSASTTPVVSVASTLTNDDSASAVFTNAGTFVLRSLSISIPAFDEETKKTIKTLIASSSSTTMDFITINSAKSGTKFSYSLATVSAGTFITNRLTMKNLAFDAGIIVFHIAPEAKVFTLEKDTFDKLNITQSLVTVSATSAASSPEQRQNQDEQTTGGDTDQEPEDENLQVKITGSNFTSIDCDGESPALYTSSDDATVALSLASSKIDSCSSSQSPEGGVIKYTYTADGGSLSLSECNVSNCNTADGKGGFLYIDASAAPSDQRLDLLVDSVLMTGNKGGTTSGSLYIECADYSKQLDSTQFKVNYTALQDNDIQASNAGSDEEISIVQQYITKPEPEKSWIEKNLGLLIGLIVGAVVLIVVVVIVIVFLFCRKKKPRRKRSNTHAGKEDEMGEITTQQPFLDDAEYRERRKASMVGGSTTSTFGTFDLPSKIIPKRPAIRAHLPHIRISASQVDTLFSRIHDQKRRHVENTFEWAATVGYEVSETVQFLLEMLYGELGQAQRMREAQQEQGIMTAEDMTKNIPLDLIREALMNLSPFSIVYSDEDELALGGINEELEIEMTSAEGQVRKDTLGNETRRYHSVERIQHPEESDRESKERNAVYTIGLIMYEVLTGTIPFEDYTSDEAVNLTCQGDTPNFSKCPNAAPPYVGLIEACLNHDGSSRPSLEAVKRQLAPFIPNLAANYPQATDLSDAQDNPTS